MKSFVILFFFCLVASGARAEGFRLVLGEGRQQHETLDVKGRNGILIRQKLSFGTYYTTEVKRSLTRKWFGTSGFPGLVWKQHMEGRQSLRYCLSDGADTAEAIALTRVADHDLVLGGKDASLPNVLLDVLNTGSASQQNNLSVAIKTRHEEKPWELFLDNTQAQLRRREATGYLHNGNRYYTIVPVWEVTRKGKTGTLPFGTAGLEFRDEEGRAVAAVSLMDDVGIVYLGDRGAEEKLLLATASAALLLQSVID